MLSPDVSSFMRCFTALLVLMSCLSNSYLNLYVYVVLSLLLFRQVQTILLSPICPHICEHIWGLLGKVFQATIDKLIDCVSYQYINH